MYTRRKFVKTLGLAAAAVSAPLRFNAEDTSATAAQPASGTTLQAAISTADILAKGTDRFEAGVFELSLLQATQTAASLSPRGMAFDFLPGDRLISRAKPGYYYLGDCTFRLRTGQGEWKVYSSAASREAVTPIHKDGALAACDLTLNLGKDCPLRVEREWREDTEQLLLWFRLTNRSQSTVEIGALGVPMVFNNLLTGRTLEEVHEHCCFADPAINGPAGYLQVTRLNGKGPVLLVVPERGTSFEAYRPLYDDPTPHDVTFEGFYEWMVHTKAYAENEWKQAEPWNAPTSRVLKPGETASYGFRFLLAPTIRKIEPTLIAAARPVAVGIPGYVLPADQTGRLFLNAEQAVKSVDVEPKEAISFERDSAQTAHGWQGYELHGTRTGRCRVRVTYADGLEQFIHYFITPPEAEQVRRLGAFHASKQWFSDPTDPFGRTFSFMPFNRETGQLVLQHPNSWFVGLSDEMGAGGSVAMAMKNLGQPNPEEIALLEKYVNNALWGHLQNPDFSVRGGLFYYDPKEFPNYPYTVHSGFDKATSESTGRSFNYPHVTAVYWSLYRLARNYEGLVKTQTWSWYLDHAYQTAMAMRPPKTTHTEDGLMVGSIFPEVIRDLRREGWLDQASKLEMFMWERLHYWNGLTYPFGSEMPWDSTGQEEIYTWSQYFEYEADRLVSLTRNAVLSYMPTVPNWAYNGAGRRYFDAPVNGTKWPQFVRMTNHYGSGINSIPILDSYRRSPGDLYLLRVGYAGMSQLMANIDAEGFGSYGFDADPAILRFDPNTADYGIAFYGYGRGAGTYVMKDPEFGWVGFGCELREENGKVRIAPRDGFRNRLYLGPIGIDLTLDCGTFEEAVFDPAVRELEIVFANATVWAPKARLRVGKSNSFRPVESYPMVRDAYEIPLRSEPTRVRCKY